MGNQRIIMAGIAGAFILEGVMDTGKYNEILDSWSQGCLELVEEMNKYTPIFLDKISKVTALNPDWPGVYEYEVINAFGDWFGLYVLEHGAVPDILDGMQKIDELSLAFFGKDGRFPMSSIREVFQ